MNDKRTVIHIKDSRTRIEIKFKDLKKGMKFKLYESTGELVVSNELSLFTAMSDAYLNESGIWEIQTDI